MIFWLRVAVAVAVSGVNALPQAGSSSSSGSSASSSTMTSVSSGTTTGASPTVSTAVPSPLLSVNSTLPAQAALPPKQSWCPSQIFCAGELLQTVNIAQLYADSKTFVDKPTVKTANATLTDFWDVTHNMTAQPTIGWLEDFVEWDFKGEGLELEATAISSKTTPAFLADNKTLPLPIPHAWASIVNGYWSDLVRDTNQSALCPDTPSGCESSLIPLNHTFVVPGGRFREQYYWDSFWIVEGLLKSELYTIAKATLQNFMDEIEQFGFIPNGGRIYYLNRSQPPVFVHMLSRYVNVTKDTSLLTRALPLAEAELRWWSENRSLTIKSPYTKKSYTVSHYAVINSAPRPESYLEDYETVNGSDLPSNYTDSQKAELYSELASGAETGWDYSTRWTKYPFSTLSNITNQEPLLRGLNVKGLVPVDLNSILYNAYVLLADLYDSTNSKLSANKKSFVHLTLANSHRQTAADRKAAILDLMWDSNKLAFYDFNTTANARATFFSAAAFYPMWNGIWPSEVLGDEKKVQAMFSSVGLVLAQYNGTFPATFITSGAQWDAPNAWPPHQYIIMEALNNVPSSVSTKAYPTLSSNTTSFSLVPSGQLGLDVSQLPLQPLASGANVTGDINYVNGTWTNAGIPTKGEKWNHALLRAIANRYFTSAFCSWYSTGGSIPGLLSQLSAQELNATFSTPDSTGHMYEKFNLLNLDTAGSGGEYTVQAGFGWTNGVVLWVAANYGPILQTPNCPAIQIVSGANGGTSQRRSNDAQPMYVGRRMKTNKGRYLVETSRETATELMYGRKTV